MIGDGAREHALAWSVARSGARVYALMAHRNPGIVGIARETGGGYFLGNPVSPMDAVKTAEEVSPDLIIIGPEEPLFRGVSDTLRERGFTVLGAPSRAALIEMRKDIARQLQWKYRIPGRLAYAVFRSAGEAFEFARSMGAAALKPIRQAGGKGVRVVQQVGKYLESVRDDAMMSGVHGVLRDLHAYDDVEPAVLVEEAVWGVEYTVQALTDGSTVFPFPPVQDNPHAYELGLGPECGGMGSVSPLDFIEDGEFKEAVDIIWRTAEAVEAEFGVKYVGVLSAQMMLTAYGPALIEYYARFGDPEALNALYMLDGDALELLLRTASGRLAGYSARFRRVYTVVKAIAPVGYPIDRALARGRTITIDWDIVRREGCLVFFGSVEEGGAGRYITLGSRALEILAPGSTLLEAYGRAERCVAAVRGDVFHRSDIGSPEYIASMVSKADMVRTVYRWRRERGLGRLRIDWSPGGQVRVIDYA